MGKYTGCECIVCQKAFEDSDDIVVCPDCGTPYHRICYQSVGHCINEPLHAVGGSWQSIQNEQRRKQGGIECSHCGYVNLPDTLICASCSLPLNAPEETDQQEQENEGIRITTSDGQQYYFQASDPCCGMSPEYDMEGERLGDIANFVRTNTLYYIPLFRRFKETDRKLSFNLPCILFPQLYFANRKMWPMAILTCLIWIICYIPKLFLNMITVTQDSQYLDFMQSLGLEAELEKMSQATEFLAAHQEFFENLQTPLFCVDVLFRIVLCLFGNYLYFRFVLKSVKKIREFAPTAHIKKLLLTAEGGTNFWNVIGCLGISYFGLYLILVIVQEFLG